MLKLSKPNIHDSDIELAISVLKSGDLVQGRFVEKFEKALCEYTGSEYACLVSSGTAALFIALKCIGIGHKTAVIVPAFSFPATANVVVATGAVPLFADVDPNTYCIDPDSITEIINYWSTRIHIKCIMPVHEFGHPAKMDKITDIARKHNLRVIEDAACSLGSQFLDQKIGTIGDIGCFSFHPRKTVTTGEGGAIMTNNKDISRLARQLRNHGIDYKNGRANFDVAALNFRITDFQAALGIGQLGRLDQSIGNRRELANNYLNKLSTNPRINCPSSHQGHSWQTFMVTISSDCDRDTVIKKLRDRQIETNIGAHDLTSLRSMRKYCALTEKATNAERLFKSGLALPMCEAYTPSEITYITNALSEIFPI